MYRESNLRTEKARRAILSDEDAGGYRGPRLLAAAGRIVDGMLGRFPLEIHLWTIPLLFATGWGIGYVHFRDALRRKHPDLFEEWSRRAKENGAKRP